MIALSNLFHHSKLFHTFLFALLGLCTGSFINILAYWLPRTLLQNWHGQHADDYDPAKPSPPIPMRIACPTCTTLLPLRSHLPLHSLFPRKQGSLCHQFLTRQFFVIEFITAGMFAFLIWHGGLQAKTLLCLLPTAGFILLTRIDLSHRLLPDCLTLPLLWLGLLINTQAIFVSVHQAIWGASLGYLSLWSTNFLFKYYRGIDGMGHGDFKFLAMLGAWWGMQSLVPIILMASTSGCLVGFLMKIREKNHDYTSLPFGPFLAAAGFFTMVGKLMPS